MPTYKYTYHGPTVHSFLVLGLHPEHQAHETISDLLSTWYTVEEVKEEVATSNDWTDPERIKRFQEGIETDEEWLDGNTVVGKMRGIEGVAGRASAGLFFLRLQLMKKGIIEPATEEDKKDLADFIEE